MNRRTKFLKALLKGFPVVFPAGAVILGLAMNFSGCETDADDSTGPGYPDYSHSLVVPELSAENIYSSPFTSLSVYVSYSVPVNIAWSEIPAVQAARLIV